MVNEEQFIMNALKEKLSRYCEDCANARGKYDARLILVTPSIGSIIKSDEAGDGSSFLFQWDQFKKKQRVIWEEYQQSKLSCGDTNCRNGKRNTGKVFS